jgi:hypothetical protein
LATSQSAHAAGLFKATPAMQANAGFLAKRVVQRQIGQMIGQNGWPVRISLFIFKPLLKTAIGQIPFLSNNNPHATWHPAR